eukprot:g2477.t1
MSNENLTKYFAPFEDNIVYLNAASRTPIPIKVKEIGEKRILEKAQCPWKYSDHTEDDAPARKAFARVLVGSNSSSSSGLFSDNNISFAPSCSYAISVAAKNIKQRIRTANDQHKNSNKNKIVILQDQMSSNVYPWQDLSLTGDDTSFHVVRRDNTLTWTEALFHSLSSTKGTSSSVLSSSSNSNHESISLSSPQQQLMSSWKDVRCVAVPNVHWCDGSRVDLELLGKRCAQPHSPNRGIGARGGPIPLVIDASQSLGILPINLDIVKPAFVASITHKWLFGPYGVCFLYSSPEWNNACTENNAVPLEFHEHTRAGASNTVNLPFRLDAPLPYRERQKSSAKIFDSGGRPNPVLLPMATEGMRHILEEWGGVEKVQSIVRERTNRLRKLCLANGFQCSNDDSSHGSPHIIGVKSKTHSSSELKAFMYNEFNIHVSDRFGCVRVAPHLYNTEKDIAVFGEALSTFQERHITDDVQLFF